MGKIPDWAQRLALIDRNGIVHRHTDSNSAVYGLWVNEPNVFRPEWPNYPKAYNDLVEAGWIEIIFTEPYGNTLGNDTPICWRTPTSAQIGTMRTLGAKGYGVATKGYYAAQFAANYPIGWPFTAL